MISTRRSLLAGLALPLAATACHPIIPTVLPRHAAACQHDAALLAMEGGILALIGRCDHILAAPTLDEDDASFHAADSALLDETRRLAEMPARTLEGLIFKARWVEHGDDDLRDSIVADLLAMGGQA